MKYVVTKEDMEIIRHTANNALQVLERTGKMNEFNFIRCALNQIIKKTKEIDKLNALYLIVLLFIAGCSTPSISANRKDDGMVEFRSGNGRMPRFAGEFSDNDGIVKIDTRLKLDLGVTALSF